METVLSSSNGNIIGRIFSSKSNVTVIDSATLAEAEKYAKDNKLSLILPEENAELPNGWEMSFINYNNGNVAFYKYALSKGSLILKFATIVSLFPPGQVDAIAA